MYRIHQWWQMYPEFEFKAFLIKINFERFKPVPSFRWIGKGLTLTKVNRPFNELFDRWPAVQNRFRTYIQTLEEFKSYIVTMTIGQ